MVQLPYRERIVQYVVSYFEERGNRPEWSARIYQDLFRKYPRHVTFKMVTHVLRNRELCEDVTPEGKEQYGRMYRLRKSGSGPLLGKDGNL